jgi:hypothetical protein
MLTKLFLFIISIYIILFITYLFLFIHQIIKVITKFIYYLLGISYNENNYIFLRSNFNNLSTSNHYYLYKNKFKGVTDKDFIVMLNNFLLDLDEYYFKYEFLTFHITFFEYDPVNNLYKALTQPFKFDYYFKHIFSGESLFDNINWTEISTNIQ